MSVLTLDLFFLLGVEVDNAPSLVASIVSLPDNNVLAFLVSISRYIKNLVILNVDEVLPGISEELEPSRVSGPHLHVSASASTLDIE